MGTDPTGSTFFTELPTAILEFIFSIFISGPLPQGDRCVYNFYPGVMVVTLTIGPAVGSSLASFYNLSMRFSEEINWMTMLMSHLV